MAAVRRAAVSRRRHAREGRLIIAVMAAVGGVGLLRARSLSRREMDVDEPSSASPAGPGAAVEAPCGPTTVQRRLFGRPVGQEQVAIFAVVAVGLVLRLYALRRAPNYLADEVLSSVDLDSVRASGHHYNGAPLGLLGRIVPTLDLRFGIAIIGTSVPYLRAVAVVFGMGSIGLAYRIGAQLSSRRVGIAAAAALALLPWHIHYSRLALPQSEYLFLTLATISFLIGALVHRSLFDGLVAVAAAVGSIYVYPASILSTPLLILTVLVAYRRELGRFGLGRVAALGLGFAVCLLPYVADHLFVGASAAAGQNEVITEKLMWTHGLSLPEVVGRVTTNWFSYINPSFLSSAGDPNIRQSSQRVGQIGFSLMVLAVIGVLVALRRRSRGDLVWLTWLVLYPFSSAITYTDAVGNSARGVFGCMPWVLAIGTGVVVLVERLVRWRPWVVAVISLAVVAQTLVFLPDYLSGYRVRASPKSEVGWSEVEPVLAASGYDQVPITLHAGYDRAPIAQYFADGHLKLALALSSCAPLPSAMVKVTVLPRVYVLRNDYDVSRQEGCFEGDLVTADLEVLRSARLPGGESPAVRILGSFPEGRPRPVVVVVVTAPPAG